MELNRRDLMKKTALGLSAVGVGSNAIGQATATSTPDKNWAYNNKASYYGPENHMATGANLTYYGGEWDTDRNTWEHDFRIASTARHRKYDPMYGAWVDEKSIRGQHLEIDTWVDDIHFWNTASEKYNGCYPNSTTTDVNYEKFAEVVIDTALGSLNEYVEWAITAKNLADALVDLDNADHQDKNITMDHTDYIGWAEASYWKWFIVDKDLDRGGNFTVDSWVNIDPNDENVGVQYTVRLNEDNASWFGAADKSSSSPLSTTDTSPTQVYKHGGQMPDDLNPNNMTDAEMRSIGLQEYSGLEINQIPESRLSVAAAEKSVPVRVLEKWRGSSRNGPFYYATDIPFVLKAEPIRND